MPDFSVQASTTRSEIQRALAQFRRARDLGALTSQQLEAWAAQAAEAFLSTYDACEGYLAASITLLCEMATLEVSELARPGVQGLFAFLVERLSDSFDPRYCALYDRLFAQVVTYCRQLSAGARLDARLSAFGLHTGEDLLARKARLKEPRRLPKQGREQVRKVLLLSRVTLGAEVAVTSVCMAAAKAEFPAAEIVLVAPPVIEELYRGDTRVRVQPVTYDRAGGLIPRLNAWLAVLAVVEVEIAGLDPSEYLVIDPDSRLTQLGIFPVVADNTRYLFFESRGYRRDGLERISALAADWLGQCLDSLPAAPYLALAEADLQAGRSLCDRLRWARPRRPLAVVNLGVGGNPRKRLDQAFERDLLATLIAQGWRVILAKGVGPEVARAERLARILAGPSLRVAKLTEGHGALDVELVTWRGSLGRYAGLMAASDLYVGYDSAGQHFAAALGVPTVDIFVDDRYPLIARRWRPYGPGPVAVLEAKKTTDMMEDFLNSIRKVSQNYKQGG